MKYSGSVVVKFNRSGSLILKDDSEKSFSEGETWDVTLRNYDDDSIIGPVVDMEDAEGKVAESVPVECFDIEEPKDDAEESR